MHFLKKDRRIYRVNELFTDELIDEFFSAGIDDIENLIDICERYEAKCPHEFKLVYNLKTKAFDAEYEYEDFMLDEDMGLVERYENWVNKCKQKL